MNRSIRYLNLDEFGQKRLLLQNPKVLKKYIEDSPEEEKVYRELNFLEIPVKRKVRYWSNFWYI
jgi:hypothetical protein